MSTYFVNGTSPLADFSADFEDLLKDFVFSKWQIADPAKGSAAQDVNATIEFRTGLPSEFKPYAVLFLQKNTELIDAPGPRTFQYQTIIDVTTIAKRLARDNIDTQLGNMEREIMRICMQYTTFQIAGIMNLRYIRGERIYETNDTFAKSRWMSVHQIGMVYVKTGEALP